HGIYTVTLTVSGPTGTVSESKINLIRVEGVTGIAASDEKTPEHFALFQNYPNPFNPTTTIAYQLPRAVHVTLKIYNVLGQEVATLVDKPMAAGSHKAVWDASGLAAGVYLYRLTAGDFRQSKKLVVLE
ncbi:MAG: T9SS C-terminal target domain-containing protein, partial [Calditrichaeota bacterium]